MSRRTIIPAVAAVLVAATLGSFGSAERVDASARTGASARPRLRVLEWTPPRTKAQRSALRAHRAVPANLTTFTRTITDPTTGVDWPITMVGRDPYLATSNRTTSIPMQIVPVRVTFAASGRTYDPTAPDNCAGRVATTATMSSPIVKPHAYTLGGTNVGVGQFTDIFRRAEFWSQTNPAGLVPRYHTKVAARVLPALSVTVPAAYGSEASLGGGCTFGKVDAGFVFNWAFSTGLPALGAKLSPKAFPMFLVSNVVGTDGSACCILGFHYAYFNGSAIQTFGFSGFDTTNLFGTPDVSIVSHEVAEWLDDPYLDNGTPAWGHTGQVSGCQADLEVGDPLTGTNLTVAMPAGVYHPQEQVFTSWFLHQTPSTGVNGWYSMNGTFTTPAAPCT